MFNSTVEQFTSKKLGVEVAFQSEMWITHCFFSYTWHVASCVKLTFDSSAICFLLQFLNICDF